MLASGGLDSGILLAEQAQRGREVFPLFLKSGLVWERAELACLRRYLRALPQSLASRVRPLKVASTPMGDLYGDHWSTTGRGVPGWRASDSSVYLPGRNIMLLAKAAVHAAMLGVPRVAIGPLKGNPFPDATPAFFRALGRGLAAGLDFPIRVEAPLLARDKQYLIRRFRHLPLHLTISCSKPAGLKPCGRCAKCRERTLALEAARTPGRAARRSKSMATK